jgi:protein-S-isoprenylcysteine O-methyltransferase Ste14
MVESEQPFRAAFIAIFVATFGISAFFRWRARRSAGAIPRAAEPRALILGRVLIGLPLFATIIAYMLNPAWLAWSQVKLPRETRWVAAVLGFATVPVTYWVFVTLGRNVSETILTKEGQALVTAGPYRWIRHPLYSTALVTFGLLSVVAASWLLALLVVLAALGIRAVAAEEEEQLRGRFGAEYAQYMIRTGRFLPRWKRGP